MRVGVGAPAAFNWDLAAVSADPSTCRASVVSPDPPIPWFPSHRYTKPTGLYANCPWDEKAVRGLILEGKLAPRFPGLEEKHKVSVTGWMGCGCLVPGVGGCGRIFSQGINVHAFAA